MRIADDEIEIDRKTYNFLVQTVLDEMNDILAHPYKKTNAEFLQRLGIDNKNLTATNVEDCIYPISLDNQKTKKDETIKEDDVKENLKNANKSSLIRNLASSNHNASQEGIESQNSNLTDKNKMNFATHDDWLELKNDQKINKFLKFMNTVTKKVFVDFVQSLIDDYVKSKNISDREEIREISRDVKYKFYSGIYKQFKTRKRPIYNVGGKFIPQTYESKEDYLKDRVNGAILMVYMDQYSSLSEYRFNNRKM